MDKKDKPIIKGYNITEQGSLGILALGDVGLRAWRKVRNESYKMDVDEEE